VTHRDGHLTTHGTVCGKAEGVDYPVEEGVRPAGKGKTVHKKHKVADMAEEVFARQATTRAERTGESSGRELRDGPHRHERAEDWQANIAREQERPG
jgi:hypothetical protein